MGGNRFAFWARTATPGALVPNPNASASASAMADHRKATAVLTTAGAVKRLSSSRVTYRQATASGADGGISRYYASVSIGHLRQATASGAYRRDDTRSARRR
jgi:hypothetical protein